MGSILKDEDSSGPVPRLRKWPRLKPIHKSSVLPHPNQPSHSIEVKPRASVEDSFKKRHEQADVESVEARRSEQPQCSDLESGQELERREVEHEAASNEVAALLRHSGVGPLKRTSSGDGVEATETNDLGWTNREGGSGELGLQDDLGSVPYSAAVQPAADLQGLRLNEGAQDTGLLCDQSEAKGRGHSELDTPSLEASAKKKRSITVVSGGSSVRSSVASVNRQPQERSRGRVSESLTDVARILNEKNGREDNSSTTVLTRRPSSARSSLRGPPGEPGGPMRRSVLTPRSNFEENGTRGKVQKVDHGTKKGAVKTQEKASALMSVSIARPLLTLASDVTSQLLKGGKSQTRRSSDLSCQATSVKAEAVGAKEARADDVAGANWETSGATEQSKRAGLDQNVSTAGALIGTTDEDDMAQSQDGLQEDTTLADTGERASSAVDNHHSAVSISSSVEEPSKSFELDRGPSSLPDEQCQPPKRLDVSDTTSIDTSAPGHHDLRDNNRPLPPARTSLSAQKLSSILKYLEEVDAGQHQYPPLPEDTAGTSVGLLGPMRMQAAHGGHRRMSTSEEGESEAGYPVDSISTASLEAASRMRGLEGSSGDASEASFLLDRTPRGATAVRSRLPERGGTGSSSPMSGSGQGPSLVASVYQGVKAKLRALKGEIALRDEAIAGLREEVQAVQEKHTADLRELESRHGASCQRQQAEYEAALARHLAFVDKLLGDKDKLAAKCTQMAADVKAAEGKFEERVQSLQEQSARELKKAREQWAAAEKVKREQWMAAKVHEVKAMTVKGLEPQLQRLIEKHKSDVQRLEARHVAELRAQADKITASHEQEQRHQRERLLKEKDDAIEQERNSAQTRLREQSERYEQQLLLARMRVGADMAVQIERAEAARRDEKKRHEELLNLKTLEAQERENALRQEMARAVQAAAAEGRAAAEKAAAQVAQERKDWEAALQERVREECARREAEMRRRCDEQMRDELKVVVARLAGEKEEELEKRVSAEVDRARQAEKSAEETRRDRDDLESRLERRIQSAVQAKADTLQALVACQEQRESLAKRGDMEGREIHNLRKQVEGLTQQLESSDAELRSRVAERTEQLRKQVGEAEGREDQLRQQLRAAVAASEAVKAKQAEELGAVEAQVRAAIAGRDATVTALQRQLFTAQQRVRDMEEQQHDLLETSM